MTDGGRRRLPRPWRTLSGRVALGAVGGVVAATLLFAAIAVGLIRSQAQAQARSELDRQAREIGRIVSVQAEDAAESGREFERQPIANLEELAGRGTRLYYVGVNLSPGSDDPNGGLPRAVAVQISPGLLAARGVQRLDFRAPGAGEPTPASAAPVVVEGRYFGAVVITRPRGEVTSAWREVLPQVLVAAGVGLVVALALVLWVTSRATRPLRDLEAATARVAGGDLKAEVATGGAEELDVVARSFNAMVRELARRDRLAREFLMRVTHDLRTPLTAIRGHALALSDGIVPESDVPRSLGAIQSEARRLEVMVTDLLDLAKLDADRFRLDAAEVDAAEPLVRALDALASEAALRDVDVQGDVPELPRITTDAGRVQQVVANLLDNALRWTPQGGTVRLTARPRGGGVRVEVADSGPGVPEAERQAVFEPFHSLPTPDGLHGSGLGLAIARQLARALGGDLVVGAAPEGGALFTLTLPAAAPAAEPQAVTGS